MSTSVEVPAGDVAASRATGSGTVHLNCPRCGLSIQLRSQWLAIRHCPRCVARSRTAVEMFSSGLPTVELYANESVPQAEIRALAGVRADKQVVPSQP
jgi:hypothetical protein